MLLIVSGDPRRRTGGNIYDRHVVAAARARGMRVAVVSVATADEVRGEVARARPRVVLADSIAFGPVADALAQLADVPLVALVHMPVHDRRAERVLRRADHVIAVSRSLARELRARGAGPVSVIRPGSDGIPPGVRRRGGVVLRVLCVANRTRAKGVDVLLRACARVPSLHIELVGAAIDPRYARSLRPLASRLGSRIRERSALPPSRLSVALARADVVVVPSRSEGYGIAASEAIAHGLPVIASDLPSLREIVGDAGAFVRPGDVTALARALDRMSDPRVRRSYARAARRRARSLPTWSDAERSVVSLLVRSCADARCGR